MSVYVCENILQNCTDDYACMLIPIELNYCFSEKGTEVRGWGTDAIGPSERKDGVE
jgi:hypothetical protein